MSVVDPTFQAALQHHQAGRLAEAEAGYRLVLAVVPEHPDSLHLLGVIAAQRGQAETAIELISRAIGRNGQVPAYHVNLGLAQQRLGRADRAEACYRKALALAPDEPDALNALGMLSQDREKFDEAAVRFERCLAVRPDHAAAQINLTLARRNQGRLDEAIACGMQAVALAPGAAEAHNNLGLALDNAGRFIEAAACFRHAVALRPDFPEAFNNLGLTLQSAGRDAAALAEFDRALVLRPGYPEAALNQAMVRLLGGDFAAGWRQYEARWRCRRDAAPGDQGLPRWDGAAGDGIVLLWAEQGLGDTLQFCRYAPLVAQRGWRVVLAVQQPLVRLLGRLDGVSRVVVAGERVSADCQCPLMSLPQYFDGIPAETPYLSPDPAEAAGWAGRLPAGAPWIGLVWAGNPRRDRLVETVVDRRRSIDLARLAPILAVPGLHFISLQKEPRPGEDPAALGLIDPMGAVRDFADTAALVAALDLVISVDTSVVHLAGALGKPAWLLNRFDNCWRWLKGRDDSPWYPTLRQFRQSVPGDWDSVIAEAAAALRSKF